MKMSIAFTFSRLGEKPNRVAKDERIATQRCSIEKQKWVTYKQKKTAEAVFV
jgi:hypothetical protein